MIAKINTATTTNKAIGKGDELVKGGDDSVDAGLPNVTFRTCFSHRKRCFSFSLISWFMLVIDDVILLVFLFIFSHIFFTEYPLDR